MIVRQFVITISLLLICVIIAIISQLGNDSESLQYLLYSYYTNVKFYEIKQGQYWRVFTPVLIHFGFLHLLMNGIILWLIGRILEPLHGSLVFFAILFIIGSVANTAQYLITGPNFGGLSGILYGLFGFIWILGKVLPYYPIRLSNKFAIIMMVWFFICWSGLLSVFGVHIANTAHTAGLISGLMIGGLLALISRS